MQQDKPDPDNSPTLERAGGEANDSSELCRMVFEHAREAIMIADRNGHYVEANPAACKMLGYTREELLEIGIEDVLVRREPPLGSAKHGETQDEDGARSFVVTLRRKDSSEIVVEVNARDLSDGRIFGVHRNITDRARREKVEDIASALRASLAESRNLAETLDMCLHAAMEAACADCGGVFLLDVDAGDLVLRASRGVSSAFVEKVGSFDARSILGDLVASARSVRHCWEDASDEVRGYLQEEGISAAALLPALHEGGVMGAFLLGSRSAAEFPATTLEALRLLSGHLESTLVKEIAVEEIRKSEARFRSLFELGQVGMGLTSLDRRWLMVNDSLCDILGRNREELIERPWAEVSAPEDLDQGVGLFNSALAGKRSSYSGEKHFVHKSGRLVHTIMSAGCVRGPDCSPQFFTVLVQDISALKAQQRELLRHREHLKELVDEKTSALTVAKQKLENLVAELEHTVQERDTLLKELEEYAYSVSHDLKSPLITINWFLGDLKDLATSLHIGVEHDIERVLGAASDMDRLLRELKRVFSTRGFSHQPVQIGLADLVEQTLEAMEDRLAERNTEVLVSQGLPTVMGDPAGVRELFVHLLDNAVKWVPEQAQPCIEIGVRHDDGGAVYFVQDNGIGIEPEYQEKVFRLFEKLDPRSDGSGVGLAIAKRIVELHQGRIWVESNGEGTGSTFCFTLSTPRAE